MCKVNDAFVQVHKEDWYLFVCLHFWVFGLLFYYFPHLCCPILSNSILSSSLWSNNLLACFLKVNQSLSPALKILELFCQSSFQTLIHAGSSISYYLCWLLREPHSSLTCHLVHHQHLSLDFVEKKHSECGPPSHYCVAAQTLVLS